MDTKYIGPFHSEHERTGRIVKTELRVESSEAIHSLLDVGVYSWDNGEAIHILRLDKDTVTELRDALDEWLEG